MTLSIRRIALKRIPWKPTDDRTTVITVRLPAKMHFNLQEQAHEARVSLNRLCLSKLSAPGDCVLFDGPPLVRSHEQEEYAQLLQQELWPDYQPPPFKSETAFLPMQRALA